MSWSDPRFAAVAQVLRASIGFDFPESRRSVTESAIRRAMAKGRLRDLGAYAARLDGDAQLLAVLVGEITVGETYFFRDPGQFDVLRTSALPDVLGRRPHDAPLRLWSAGCSTGEEAFSLAILTDACGCAARTHIVATDVSPAALERARRGQYGAWSFREALPFPRERSFTPVGKRWAVAPALLARVAFSLHNLLDPAPAAGGDGYDIVLCRNVLIYLEPAAVERVVRRLVAALAPGGWLVTSPTDPLLSGHDGLEARPTAAGLVYRHLPAPPTATASPSTTPAPKPARAAPLPAARPPVLPPPDPGPHVERALRMLDRGEPPEAALAARRAISLDPSLEVAHLALGRALRLMGRRRASRHALEHSRELLARLDAAGPVRHANEAVAGALIAVATAELALVDRGPGR